jgi:hypothetical protein
MHEEFNYREDLILVFSVCIGCYLNYTSTIHICVIRACTISLKLKMKIPKSVSHCNKL